MSDEKPKTLADVAHEILRDSLVNKPVYKREQRQFEGSSAFCHLCLRRVPAAEVKDEVCDECHNEPD